MLTTMQVTKTNREPSGIRISDTVTEGQDALKLARNVVGHQPLITDVAAAIDKLSPKAQKGGTTDRSSTEIVF